MKTNLIKHTILTSTLLISSAALAQTNTLEKFTVIQDHKETFSLGKGVYPKAYNDTLFMDKTCLKNKTIKSQRGSRVEYDQMVTYHAQFYYDFLSSKISFDTKGSIPVNGVVVKASLDYSKTLEKTKKLNSGDIALVIKATETGLFDQIDDYEFKDEYKSLLGSNKYDDFQKLQETCGTHYMAKEFRSTELFLIAKLKLSTNEMKRIETENIKLGGSVGDIVSANGSYNTKNIIEEKIKNGDYKVTLHSDGIINMSALQAINIEANIKDDESVTGLQTFLASAQKSLNEAIKLAKGEGTVTHYLAVSYSEMRNRLDFFTPTKSQRIKLNENLAIYHANEQVLAELDSYLTKRESKYAEDAKRVLKRTNKEILGSRNKCIGDNDEIACDYLAKSMASARAYSNAVEDVEIFPSCFYDENKILRKVRINAVSKLYNPAMFTHFIYEVNGQEVKELDLVQPNLDPEFQGGFIPQNTLVFWSSFSPFVYVPMYIKEHELKGENYNESYEIAKRIYNNVYLSSLVTPKYPISNDAVKVKQLLRPTKQTFCPRIK